MKRFRSAVLLLAVTLSLVFHVLLFRLLVFERPDPVPDTQKIQINLKYYQKPTIEEIENTAPREKKERRRRVDKSTEEKSPEETKPAVQELPVPEQEPETGETDGDDTDAMDASTESNAGAGPASGATVPSAESDSDVFDRAVSELRMRIMEKMVYPQAARRRNIEGVVLIYLELDAAGELVELRILKTSDSSLLDRAALTLVRKVTPYEHGLEKEFSVEIPIRYSLTE
jgi:protein TonB